MRFYRVKQNLFIPTFTVWKDPYHKSSKMPKLLSSFFESGIFTELDSFDKYTTRLKRKK